MRRWRTFARALTCGAIVVLGAAMPAQAGDEIQGDSTVLELPVPEGAISGDASAEEVTIESSPLPTRRFDGDWSSTARTPLVYAAISPWASAWGGWAWNPHPYPWGWGYHPQYWAYLSVADSLYRPWWYYPYHFRPNWQSQYLPYYGSGRAGFTGPGGMAYGAGPAAVLGWHAGGDSGWWSGLGGWGHLDAIWAPWGGYCGSGPMVPGPYPLRTYEGCLYW